MAGDERATAAGSGGDVGTNIAGDAEVDFVVGEAAPPREPDRSAAGVRTADPSVGRHTPPWLRRRGPIAAAAVVFVLLGLFSRSFATHRHAADGSPSPQRSDYTAPVVAAPSPTTNEIAPGQCAYRLQPVTVHELPGEVTSALSSLLPGVDVQTSSTALGHGRAPGPCVVQREILAVDHGVLLQIEVRPAAAGDHNDSGSGAGSSGENLYVDVVAEHHTVHISASQPYGAQGSSAVTVATLGRLAADPRLAAA
ncbi:hypothetical protein [uncultured Jatrophihabitans sp.]|uniref:hypothetical protein n=1 Tax=uncultured Jatrophihabitans sp. TaxID=1610747 RepID=UPI0035CB490D